MDVIGVVGICAANQYGDLYCARGTMDERSGAILAQLAMLAAELEHPIEPIISLKGDRSQVLIRRYNNLVSGLEINPISLSFRLLLSTS